MFFIHVQTWHISSKRWKNKVCIRYIFFSVWQKHFRDMSSIRIKRTLDKSTTKNSEGFSHLGVFQPHQNMFVPDALSSISAVLTPQPTCGERYEEIRSKNLNFLHLVQGKQTNKQKRIMFYLEFGYLKKISSVIMFSDKYLTLALNY